MSLPPLVAAVLAPPAAAPRDVALLLDFDGTLSHIVPRSEDARLVAGAREALEALRGRLGLLGFVSGRGLADLEGLVGIPGCAYAGNHGMEIRHPGGPAEVVPEVRPWVARVNAFGAALDAGRLDQEGIRLEDKGASLSLHWRTAPDPVRAEDAARRWLAPHATVAGFAVTWGRMVMEVRPPVVVHKGTAIRALVAAAGTAVAAYVGDDRTDADGWAELRRMADRGELRRCLAVAADGDGVPPAVLEAADVHVPGPEGVLAMLRGLLAAIG
ncbi:MAG: trehalose-phosphatase [Thermoleophilia bacterium]|nr:trehalose-phosphatase [Thermoleophilia bacterium]